MVDAVKLLGEFELHGCRPRASFRAEPVEYIVKLDYGREAGIDDGLHELL